MFRLIIVRPTTRMNDRTAHHTSETRPFQFTGRIRSFRHAVAGVLRMIRCQHNAWIHVAATFVVTGAAFFLRISAADWCWIILAISIVWTAEAINTAFEFLADAANQSLMRQRAPQTSLGNLPRSFPLTSLFFVRCL